LAKEKEHKDLQETKAPEKQDSHIPPVPVVPLDEDEDMAEDPDPADVDNFLASWGPQDLITKPQEEEEALRKRATEQLRGSPKRQKQG
jgi:hypothetical protein